VSVARFIAYQRARYRVPHTITCLLLGISVSWFYKWIARADSTDGLHTDTDRRRAQLDAAVASAFEAARGLHGSPRLVADLRDLGWEVSEKSVADSMRRQGLVARKIRRRHGLTRQDKTAPKFADLLKRDFTAAEPNRKWVGDITEIPTDSGPKLYLATVIDLFSRRLLGAAMGLHPDAELACGAIKMAVLPVVAARRSGGRTSPSGLFSIPTAGALIPHTRSPRCAGSWGFGSRWAGSDRVSTMLPLRRSSPRWNGKYSRAIVSVRPSKRRLWSSTGATPSTITNADTVPPTGSRPPTTRSGNPKPSRKRHRKPSTISGEPHSCLCPPPSPAPYRKWCAVKPSSRSLGASRIVAAFIAVVAARMNRDELEHPLR